jgi:hypothetical protein
MRVPVRARRPVLVEGPRALAGGLSRFVKGLSEQPRHLTSRFIEACTASAYLIVTDRGDRDRREENLRRVVSEM